MLSLHSVNGWCIHLGYILKWTMINVWRRTTMSSLPGRLGCWQQFYLEERMHQYYQANINVMFSLKFNDSLTRVKILVPWNAYGLEKSSLLMQIRFCILSIDFEIQLYNLVLLNLANLKYCSICKIITMFWNVIKSSILNYNSRKNWKSRKDN